MIVLDVPTLYDGMLVFLLISIRLGAMFLAGPLFSAAVVTLPQRIALTMGVTIALYGTIPVPKIDFISFQGLIVISQEILVGSLIGFFMQFAFSAVTFSGEQMSSAMGLSYAAMVDPQTGASSPVVAQFLSVILILIFLTLGGHHLLIREVATSYKLIPMGEFRLTPKMFLRTFEAGVLMFSMALLISLPVVVAMMLINIVTGVMTRVAPQMNIFSVGFPVTILSGLALMMVMMPTIGHLMADFINQMGLRLHDLVLLVQEG
jgi:flagellar biosynthetic protein FliR